MLNSKICYKYFFFGTPDGFQKKIYGNESFAAEPANADLELPANIKAFRDGVIYRFSSVKIDRGFYCFAAKYSAASERVGNSRLGSSCGVAIVTLNSVLHIDTLIDTLDELDLFLKRLLIKNYKFTANITDTRFPESEILKNLTPDKASTNQKFWENGTTNKKYYYLDTTNINIKTAFGKIIAMAELRANSTTTEIFLTDSTKTVEHSDLPKNNWHPISLLFSTNSKPTTINSQNTEINQQSRYRNINSNHNHEVNRQSQDNKNFSHNHEVGQRQQNIEESHQNTGSQNSDDGKTFTLKNILLYGGIAAAILAVIVIGITSYFKNENESKAANECLGQSGTLENCIKYKNDYSQGDKIKDVENKINEFQEKTKESILAKKCLDSSGALDECNNYSKNYPDGNHIGKIKEKISALICFEDKNKSGKCNNYLFKYPDGKYKSEIQKIVNANIIKSQVIPVGITKTPSPEIKLKNQSIRVRKVANINKQTKKKENCNTIVQSAGRC